MKCTIPEISWHNRDPVLAVDLQPNTADGICRLATAGTDTHVVIWQLRVLDNGGVSVEALSDLTRHTRAVNAVRFSPSGDFLASADDEGAIILWRRQEGNGGEGNIFEDGTEGGENKENWGVAKMLRGHLEDVYDLSWSTCSDFLISGSVDNTAILWDVTKGKSIALLNEHKGFVQGVSWDPLGQYVATLCSDRYCRIYNIASKKIIFKIHKATMQPAEENNTEKTTRLFYDDTLKSFCRRLSFSPDGNLLLAPSGIMESDTAPATNGTYIFLRQNFTKPVLYLPTKDKYTLAVRFCPVLFQLRPVPPASAQEELEEASEEQPNLFQLPYRMVFAIATQNAVLLYDTQQPVPFAKLSNIHYTRLSDIAWSSDGQLMVVSSTDGYCSLVSFSAGELGELYQKEPEEETLSVNSSTPPHPTPDTHSEPVEEEEKKVPSPTETSQKKPIMIKRASNGNKPGKRVALVTLSGPGLQSEDKVRSDLNQSNCESQEEEMEVDEEMKLRFESDKVSPNKETNQTQAPDSPSRTPNRTPRRVPLITLSSPKGKKKNSISDFR